MRGKFEYMSRINMFSIILAKKTLLPPENTLQWEISS